MVNIDKEGEWDLVIKPRKHLLDINLAEVWQYRDLIWLFVRRDFVAQYKQTILGPLWHIIQPILTTIIFLVIFGRIARIPTDGIEPVLFYISGITLWNYFSACLTSTSSTFVSNASIFGKVYFPRLVIPIAVVLSNIVRFGIQFGLLIILFIYFNLTGQQIVVTVNWLFIPVLVLLMAMIGLGLGIIISSLTTKYRDFSVLLTFGVQLAMYATPIVYPLSYLKGTNYEWFIRLNPLTAIVEAFRFALFGRGTFQGADLLFSLTFMVTVLLVGLISFNRVERSFMDTV